MATERIYSRKTARKLAASAALLQLLLSNCSSKTNDDSLGTTAASGGNTAPSTSAAAGRASQPSASGSAGAAASSSAPRGTPSSSTSGGAGTSVNPAAMSGSAGNPSAAAGKAGAAAAQAGASGTTPTASAGTSGSTDTSMTSSTFPAVSDFKAAGPFTPTTGAGPSGYVLYYPQELGKDGVKHPIVSWGPGAAETAADFSMLLKHLASHGFAVISFDGTPNGPELITGIDWMLAENKKEGGMFFQKLDETKISAGGHSAGSLATFVIGGDKRLVTTMHISGGTFDPHTDIMNLHAPALFVCGEPDGDGLLQGDVANPNCLIDFDNAKVPVFFGITKGAAHMTPTDIGDPAIRTHQFGAMIGWLRWQLAGDTNAKSMFVGDSCGLCMDAAWGTVKQKSLN